MIKVRACNLQEFHRKQVAGVVSPVKRGVHYDGIVLCRLVPGQPSASVIDHDAYFRIAKKAGYGWLVLE